MHLPQRRVLADGCSAGELAAGRCYHPPVVAGQGEFRIPAPADEARLWALVEAAWAPLGPEVRQARQELVNPLSSSRADISLVKGALPAFLGILAGCSRRLPADELTRLDRVVERKLWELDRADVHAVTGGSADGSCIAAASSWPWAGSSAKL